MSLLDGISKMRLIKVGPSLQQRMERWIAAAHHRAVVSRLRRFREQLDQEMKPEPWTVLEAPMPLIVADVCDALGLDNQERATVLGAAGVLALTDVLETTVRPILSPRVPVNERQAKALRYMREHGEINIGVYRQICPYWSDETLRLDMADLAARGLLIKNGAKRGTYYVLAKQG
jgi:hypothetical protein